MVAQVNESAGILYMKGPGHVTFLDASTGAYRYGTYAASMFQPDPDEPTRGGATALSESNGILYWGGIDKVIYLDAVTGQYINGTLPASSIPVVGTTYDLAVSEGAGGLYAEVYETVTYHLLFLDAAAPGYLFGSYVASTISSGAYKPINALLVDEAEGHLYVANGVNDNQVRVYDAATGALLATFDATVERMVLEPQRRLIYGFAPRSSYYLVGAYRSTVVYLDAASLTPVNGTLAAAEAIIGGTGTYGMAFDASLGRLAVLRKGEEGFDRDHGVVLLDLDVPAYATGPRLADVHIPTGAGPSAVVAID